VRAAAGAIRIGNTVGAAFTGRRTLEPVEAGLVTGAGALLLVLAVLFAVFPRAFAYPLLIILVWLGLALFYRSWKLHRESKQKKDAAKKQITPRQGQ
jgi:cardiolipin synthase